MRQGFFYEVTVMELKATLMDEPALKRSLVRIAHEIIENGECCTLHGLAIKGSDLEDIGFEGRQIGEALDQLLVMVIDEKLPNERSALIDAARDFGSSGRKRVFEL